MKKIISFSLWGCEPKYCHGALRNAELAKEIYPGWICRFYIDVIVPPGIKYKLSQYDNVEIVETNEIGDWRGMFWRFCAIDDDDVEIMIVRDTDSRLNYREKYAVDEWLMSDKGFHVMRDHPRHQYSILGGMWGIKKDIIKNMEQLVSNFEQRDVYGTDYVFLAHVLIPLIENDVMIHDEFFAKKPFPRLRINYEFVGQVYDENDVPTKEYEDELKKAIGGGI